MNKVTKVILTIIVFVLVVLYFIKAFGNITINREPSDGKGACATFNTVLNQRVEEFFKNDLPETEGDSKTASIDDLIAAGLITLEELTPVGTACTGNITVIKGNGNKYFYSNDVTCGTCSTANLYNNWSEWTNFEPTGLGASGQIQAGIYYNYGKGEKKFSDWSEWTLSTSTPKEPSIPSGAELIDTETEQKTQYSYRDGTFKWYKLTSAGTSYYNNGAFSETSPGSGYSKDVATKKTSRTTTANISSSALKATLTGLDYDMVTTSGYRLSTVRNIYARTETVITTTCAEYQPYYRCYKDTTRTASQACYTTDYATASNACYSISGVTSCNITTCPGTPAGSCSCPNGGSLSGNMCYTTSGGTYYFSANFNFWTSKDDHCDDEDGCNCTVECTNMPSDYSGSCTSGVSACLSGSKATLGRNYTQCTDGGSASYMIAYSASGYIRYSLGSPSNCRATSYSNGNGTTSSYAATCPAGTPDKYGYSYTVTTRSEYGSGQNTSCPSGYSAEYNGYNQNVCLSYANDTITYYLTQSGGETTDRNSAGYFTASEYSALGKGSTYSKTSYSKTDYDSSDYVEGSCPSGKTCTTSTMYKATVYTYKWYKTTSASKEYSDSYSATSPGSGWTLDESSAKWGEWSGYSDDKVITSTTRQVRTQVLKRIRRSYTQAGGLALTEWLPLGEFEKKVGKTVGELKEEPGVTVQTKMMYRYKTLK